MEQRLSDGLKAILLKISLELKTLGWKVNPDSSDIDIAQDRVSMLKDITWDGDGDLPDVDVNVTINLSLAKNEQNGVYFVVYTSEYGLFITNVGGSDEREESDLDTPFTEQDVNNINKFQEASRKLNGVIDDNASEYAHDFASQSYQHWRDYEDAGFRADRDDGR